MVEGGGLENRCTQVPGVRIPYYPNSYQRRDARVAEGNGLLNRRTSRYRGFESHSLRKKIMMEKYSKLSYKILSAIAYLPFIGWIVTILFTDRDKLLEFHTKQAYKLTIYMLSFIIALYFIDILLPLSLKNISYFVVLFHNIVITIYFIFSLVMIGLIFLDKKVRIPLITRNSTIISN